MEWNVEFTFDGAPGEDVLVRLGEAIDAEGMDGSVSANPVARQWSMSFGVDDAASVADALHEAELMLGKAGVADSVVAVDVVEMSEFLRRAEVPSMPALVGASEVADMLGVKRQRVHQLYREKPGFPVPLVQVAMGPLWDELAIRAFDRQWTRKPGRPVTTQ